MTRLIASAAAAVLVLGAATFAQAAEPTAGAFVTRYDISAVHNDADLQAMRQRITVEADAYCHKAVQAPISFNGPVAQCRAMVIDAAMTQVAAKVRRTPDLMVASR